VQCRVDRVGQNHIYTVYIRCFGQEYHQIYGHRYTVHIYSSGQPYVWTISLPRTYTSMLSGHAMPCGLLLNPAHTSKLSSHKRTCRLNPAHTSKASSTAALLGSGCPAVPPALHLSPCRPPQAGHAFWGGARNPCQSKPGNSTSCVSTFGAARSKNIVWSRKH